MATIRSRHTIRRNPPGNRQARLIEPWTFEEAKPNTLLAGVETVFFTALAAVDEAEDRRAEAKQSGRYTDEGSMVGSRTPSAKVLIRIRLVARSGFSIAPTAGWLSPRAGCLIANARLYSPSAMTCPKPKRWRSTTSQGRHLGGGDARRT
jgi:hypothetical protein